LLGYADGNNIDIQSCFSVPLSLEKEHGKKTEVIISMDYCQKMLKFQRKVNPKEGLIGLYMTGQNIEQEHVIMYQHYQKLNAEQKTKPAVKQPLLMLIDPTMQDNKLSIKVRRAKT
jgi:predicted N-acyltransferase